MILPGGGADKLGNRYEGYWTVLEMLSVLEEKANSIAIEPPGEEGKGVEFVLETDQGKLYYQVKRRNKAVFIVVDRASDTRTARTTPGHPTRTPSPTPPQSPHPARLETAPPPAARTL
jgi:hypothetical protein